MHLPALGTDKNSTTSTTQRTENIGARRLHTIMERLLETLSYAAADKNGEHVIIDAAYVEQHVSELSKDEDLSRYIL